VYIMVDGSAVNTRQKDETGSTWEENKLGIGSQDAEGWDNP
jgi:hypothetical protein